MKSKIRVIFKLTFAVLICLSMFAGLGGLTFSRKLFLAQANSDEFNPGFGRANGDFLIYLPLILTDYPAPVLNEINNPDGDGSYIVSWTSVASTTQYILQEDDNESFSSPTTAYEGSSTSKSFSGKAPGTYYYRVKAKNDYSESAWSNIRWVRVEPPLAKVYVQNDLGVTLCYEVLNTGIGKKCFSSGKHFYGSFSAGTYTFHATATGYYPIKESKYFPAGELIHEFYNK